MNEDTLVIKLLDGKTDNTRKTYSKELENLSSWLKGAPFASVTKETAQAYYDYLKKQNMKDSSIIKIIRILRSFYELGKEYEVFESNPFNYVKLPNQKFGYVDMSRTLTLDEFQKVLVAAKNNKRDYAMVLLLTTSRFTVLEITNFSWSNIKVDALGNYGAEIQTKGSTESKPKTRLIPIRKDAYDALMAYKGDCIDLFGDVDNKKVFLNRYGKPLSEVGIRKNIYALCKAAGIKKQISPKDLTHLAVAYGKIFGGTDQQLVEQAGFSSPQLIKKYDYVLDMLRNPSCKLIKLPEH